MINVKKGDEDGAPGSSVKNDAAGGAVLTVTGAVMGGRRHGPCPLPPLHPDGATTEREGDRAPTY